MTRINHDSDKPVVSEIEAEILERHLLEVDECKCGADLELREVEVTDDTRSLCEVRIEAVWACTLEEGCSDVDDGFGRTLRTTRELSQRRAREELEKAYQEHRQSVREQVEERIQARHEGDD